MELRRRIMQVIPEKARTLWPPLLYPLKHLRLVIRGMLNSSQPMKNTTKRAIIQTTIKIIKKSNHLGEIFLEVIPAILKDMDHKVEVIVIL